MNPRNHNHYPYLSIHRDNDPEDPATDASVAAETPAYLAPVLAVYDNPAAAAQRERATILYCQGHRTADIAAQLHVPVSTIRSWLTDARYLLTAELRVSREELQLRAIESARALAAEAWTAYERDRDLQRAILSGAHDYPRRRITRPDRDRSSHPHPPTASSPLFVRGEGPGARFPVLPAPAPAGVGALPAAPAAPHISDNDPTGNLLYEEFERPRYTSQAARLLTVALAAQREVARLQGLYEHVPPPPQPVDFHLYGPSPEPAAPTSSGVAEPPSPSAQPESSGLSPSSPPDTQPGASDQHSKASITSPDNGASTTSAVSTAPIPVESGARDCRGALRAPGANAEVEQTEGDTAG